MGLSFHRLSSHLFKRVLYINSVQRAGFIELDVVILTGPLLSACRRNLSLILLVQLISEADERKVLGIGRPCIFNESTLPLVQIFEGLLVREVVAECAAVGTSIESVAQRLELFLTSGVPNLKRNNCIVDKNLLFAEVSSDGWLALPGSLAVEVLL